MKLIMTIFYCFGANDVYIEPPKFEIVAIFIEHIPQELKNSKRDRWWPVKPYNTAG